MNRVQIVKGDITALEVDIIVNAANHTLLGGGGVDGAIHSAAGPQLLEECRALGGCETGQAKITRGYNLPCKFVVHTVGPVYKNGRQGEAALLANCYRNCLAIAHANKVASIAFPCISTGVFHYPFMDACSVALDAVYKFLEVAEDTSIREILMVCHTQRDYQVYSTIYKGIYG